MSAIKNKFYFQKQKLDVRTKQQIIKHNSSVNLELRKQTSELNLLNVCVLVQMLKTHFIALTCLTSNFSWRKRITNALRLWPQSQKAIYCI